MIRIDTAPVFHRSRRPVYPVLRRGLLALYAPCLGPTGNTLRDVSGGDATNGVRTGGGTLAWVAGGVQTGPEGGGGDRFGLGPCPWLEDLNGLSVIAYVKPLVGPITWGTEDGVAGNVGIDPELFLIRFDSANTGQVQVGLETSTTDVGSTYAELTCGDIQDEWHIMGIIADAGTTINAVFDDQIGSSVTKGGNWITGAYGDFFDIGTTGVTGDIFDGVIGWVGFWNRPLIRNELNLIARDPMSLFRTRPFAARASGGGAKPFSLIDGNFTRHKLVNAGFIS